MRSEGRIFTRGRVFWIAYYVRGKEYREPAGKTAKAAKDKLKQRLGEKFGDRFIGPKEEKVTVGDLLDSLTTHLETRGAKAVRTFKCHLRPVKDRFGFVRAMDLTTGEVENYIADRLKANKARATVNREVSVIKPAYHLARKQGRIGRLPYFPMLREENARQGFFEKDEFERVARTLPEELADAAQFAYLTGWRRGEVLSLGWEAVDRSAREVRLATSKNGRGRVVPLDGKLWEVFERRWRAREFRCGPLTGVSALVFHHSGKPLRDFRKSWAAACKAAGVPGRLFHDLRRTAVRNFIRAGVPETVAMAITGHRTRAVFDRYNITSEADKRTAILRAQEHLATSSSESNVSTFRAAAGHGQKADNSQPVNRGRRGQ